KRNGADRQAIRQALEVLKHGNVLGIFPEGTRGDGVRLLKAQPGTVLLAARSGTPIVPMAIVGAEKALPLGKLLPRPSKVKVFIGEPIYLPKFPRKSYRDALGKYSRDLMDKIDELRSYEIAA
ncbi:MAG: 1-acyl-sn-glycerol-3-phosphate acyltransferase, partial [Firmicutes bacterium]|nr:1-acyl-sn-glycerol-3-phosphate acyltransferase [Bacillota bacterium]